MTRLGQGPIQLKMPQYFHSKRVPSKGKERVGFDALNKMKQNRVKEKVYCSTIGPRQELLQFIGEKERLECLGLIDYWVGGRLECYRRGRERKRGYWEGTAQLYRHPSLQRKSNTVHLYEKRLLI
jgi:hypothetical protein